jgi:hypothetical protein
MKPAAKFSRQVSGFDCFFKLVLMPQGWLGYFGHGSQGLIAEKGAKIVIFWRFCKNRPAGVSRGRVVCFWTHWRVKVSILRL